MYLTTYGKYHRSFKPTEHDDYARKDAATYWDLEGHPKAWGHGVDGNPVPHDAVAREHLPMRDEAQFKHPSKVPCSIVQYSICVFSNTVLVSKVPHV